MPQYTVEIRACNVEGSVWQAMHPAETVEAESAADAAVAVAYNQNLALAGDYRVLAWDGEDADTGTEPAAVYMADRDFVEVTEEGHNR